ncbi:MAG: NUDIX domain-containing protein [Halanaerobiales bacterium]|nr:NUDIX domain-containing protein [Halanaerobiales bacterium]
MDIHKNGFKLKEMYRETVKNLLVDQGEFSIEIKDTQEDIAPIKGVAVVALTSKDQVLLIQKQDQKSNEGLEIPSDNLQSGEEPALAAKRILKDETGYLATSVKEIALCYSDSVRKDKIFQIFWAKDVILDSEVPGDSVNLFTLKEIDTMLSSFELKDEKTIVGLVLVMSLSGD